MQGPTVQSNTYPFTGKSNMGGIFEGQHRSFNEPDMSRFFDRLVQRPDDILAIEIKLAIFVHPSFKVFSKSASGDSHVIPVNHLLLHEEVQDFCREVSVTE